MIPKSYKVDTQESCEPQWLEMRKDKSKDGL
jgi:hypothetical protein